MGDPRHPRIKDLPFTVPENIDPDAFLFLGDPTGRDRSIISKYWMPGAGGMILLGACLFTNAIGKRPLQSGLHKTILLTLTGGLLGKGIGNYKEKFCSERDLQLFHYICLHPEDFPPPKRVLFRDYLREWTPIR